MKNKLSSLKERIIKNFSENKVLFFVCIAIWTITIILTLVFYNTSLGMDSIGPNDYTNVVEVNENTSVAQVLPVENETNSFGIYFASYRRNNSGKVNIKVTGNDSKVVYVEKSVNVDLLQDNAFKMFELSETLNSKKDKTITIELSSNSKEGKAVGVYYGEGKYNQKDNLTINNKDIDGTLVYRFMIKNEILNRFNSIIVISAISVLSLIIIWLLLYKPQLEYFFAVFIFVLGLIFMAIMSPSSPPDETIHLEYAVQESNLLMFNNDIYDVDSQYVDNIAHNYYVGTVNDKKAYIDLIESIGLDYEPGDKTDAYDVDINEIYKIQYIPQSIGILIARLLKLNPLKVFYSGRFTNLLFFTLCIFFCIKNTPIHKTLFGILASLPILVQQAASYSYDSFINGLCFLTIGLLFKMKFSEGTIKIKDYIVAFIVCLLLAPAKYIYGLLALLFWLVPKEKYGNNKKKIILTLILCSPMMYQLYPVIIDRLMFMIRIKLYVKADTSGSEADINPLYNTAYVVSHFGKTIKVIITTIRYNLKIWFYESIGRYLSQLTLVLPLTIVRFIIAAITAAVFVKDDLMLNAKTRICLIAVCVAIAMFSIGGMLFSETHIGDEYISGIQGRYYSPLLPYFFVSLTNNKINIPKKFNIYVIFAYILVMFEVIMYILSYTFVI